jgi:2-polyprenyl-3-methyl-5-hydroxy-6-metoxy-1,4-benzoquinol methylase
MIGSVPPTVTKAAARSIADFGEQWTHFPGNAGYYGSLELFRDLLHPLLAPEHFRGARVADVGSGTGRIVRMLADVGVAEIIAVEPSAAFDVLKANTRDLATSISYVHGTGERLPVDRRLDVVTSIGVLHHIPNPRPVVARMLEALRPGGIAVIWVYAREGNRAYLAIARPLRSVTTRLPHPVLAALCWILDVPLTAYLWLCRYVPLPLWRYMRNHLCRLTPAMRRLTIYDQLNPHWAKYYTRDEARLLLEAVGFVDVNVHHRHGYSWLVVGRKPGNDD